MAAYLSPIGNDQQADANGAPVSGALINTYIAGTTTPVVTYTDAAGLVPQANPIVCNAAGYPASPIFLPAGVAIKMVFTTSVASGSVAYRPAVDNITGVNDPSFATTVSEWTAYSGTPSFISATSFSVTGDQTNTFQALRRLKSTNTGGTIYSSVTAAIFAAGITTVTVTNTAGVLDSGLSAVSYGLLSVTNPSIPETTIGRALRVAVSTSAARDAIGVGTGSWRNGFINGGMSVAQGIVPSLSTTAQIGAVDMIYAWASAGAVSAGTITQNTAATVGTSGYACRVAGATLTGSAVLSFRKRIPSRDAKAFKNTTAVFQCKVMHDVGSSVNYTIIVRKPTLADNYGATTTIVTGSATAVATGTGTTLTLPAQALGDVSNGLEVEVQAACGAITTKNFDVTEWQIAVEGVASDFEQRPFEVEFPMCRQFRWKTFPYATAPAQNAGVTGAVSFTQVVGSATVQPHIGFIQFDTAMFAVPSLTFYNPQAANALPRNVQRAQDWSNASASVSTSERGVTLISYTSSAAGVAGDDFRIHILAEAPL